MDAYFTESDLNLPVAQLDIYQPHQEILSDDSVKVYKLVYAINDQRIWIIWSHRENEFEDWIASQDVEQILY